MNQPHASLYTGPLEIPSNPSLPFHPSKSSQSPELGKNHFKVEVIAASLPWLNVMFVQFRYCRCLSWYPFILLSFHRIFFRISPLEASCVFSVLWEKTFFQEPVGSGGWSRGSVSSVTAVMVTSRRPGLEVGRGMKGHPGRGRVRPSCPPAPLKGCP